MKKLVAIVLTLMLLAASVACAETAYEAVYYNSVLTATSEGQTFTVDLSDLTVTIAAGALGDVPTIQIDVDDGEEILMGAEVQIYGSALVLNVDGLSRPLAVDLSSAGVSSLQETLAPLFADPANLRIKELPTFKGVTIPKLPLMSLAGFVGATPTVDANGVQVAEFSVPYEMVKQVLGLLSQYRSTIESIGGVSQYAGAIFGLIDQLMASDSGFAMSGTITDDGEAASMVIDFLPVSGGVTAESAIAGLELMFAENQANINVNIYQGGGSMTVAQMALTSVPEAAELNFGLDIMGMIALNFSLYPENGAQVIAVELKAQDQAVNLSFTYGPQGDGSFFDFAFSIPNTANVEYFTESSSDDGVTYNGDLALTLESGSYGTFTLGSESTTTIADVALRGIENAGDAIDVVNISDEEKAQVTEELNAALAGLITYFNGLEPELAA